MVAAFLVFCLVIDNRAVDFNLAGREVALEVLHIGGGVPQAPFLKREQFDSFLFRSGIFEGEFLHLCPSFQGNKEESRSLDAVFHTFYNSIVHTVAAFVKVERGFARFPSGRPNSAVVVDVEIAAAVVHRYAVVAVAGDAAEFGVLIKAVAARSI